MYLGYNNSYHLILINDICFNIKNFCKQNVVIEKINIILSYNLV